MKCNKRILMHKQYAGTRSEATRLLSLSGSELAVLARMSGGAAIDPRDRFVVLTVFFLYSRTSREPLRSRT